MSELTILSIDDNSSDQKLMELAFKEIDSGTNLQLVVNGDEAISYLWKLGPYAQARRPDLIILDLNLPKITGPEVIAQVRNDPSLKAIPIVVFTRRSPSESTR